ncbi:MAG TPA: hypothetical protein VN524_13250, partial [Hyphomicrobiaceae bacterium]|nr:hypothetical protein [Hyphomicrobiaceae bacterium]
AAIERAVAARADLLAGPSGIQAFVRPETPTILGPASATFKVTYTGFSAAAKAAFQRAVNLWLSRTFAAPFGFFFLGLSPGLMLPPARGGAADQSKRGHTSGV